MAYIIAEAGVNHNGSLELAKKLAFAAKEAGANAVKFQTFKSENLVTKKAAQAKYQVDNLGETTSQYDMLKKLELSYDEFTQLKQYCDYINIEFLSTPFDIESVDFLLGVLNMRIVKISSGEITNLPFLYETALYHRPIIISTGMATINEIQDALAYIAYGLASKHQMKESLIFDFYNSLEAKKLLKSYVTILHCTTEYPAPYETINLKAMVYLKKKFNVRIGLSDHSHGVSVPVGSVALGAEIIEKHFTLDKKMEGPDHIASLDPNELKMMVENIRQIEKALGDGIKKPTQTEILNRIAARKSLVAKKDITQGDIFTKDNLTVKRPGSGLPPSLFWKMLGQTSKKSYYEDELIDE